LLDEMLAPWSEEDRVSALANLRVKRELTDAAREHGF
jgi:hypothetical protein